MHPVEPKLHPGGELRIFGAGQEQYIPLPASVDAIGSVVTEWELSAEDLEAVLNGGRIRLYVLFTGVNNGIPMSPIKMEVVND